MSNFSLLYLEVILMIVLSADDLPEEISQHIQAFLLERPDWTQTRILQSALSLFLLQNGISDRAVSQLYLQAMFPNFSTIQDTIQDTIQGEIK